MKCFYHLDADGKCAAYWVHKRYPVLRDIDFIKMNYDSNIDWFSLISKDEYVIIVDFSFEPDDMRKILSKTKNVVWIDHHKSAIEKYKDFGEDIKGIRYDGIAGCMLTYCYYFVMVDGRIEFNENMTKSAPWMTKYIADHDVWKFEFGEETEDFKYNTGDEPSYLGDVFMLRTAEAYLNAAEAYAMLDDAGNASKYLNDLRTMRHENYTSVTYDANEIVQEVRDERRRELCFEGHRWFDLRRYAVCEEAPYNRTIEHVFPLYDQDNRNAFQSAEVYRLEIDDPAYTFAIPKDVLNFDSGMPDNPREMREYVRTIVPDDDEGEEEVVPGV